MSMEHETQLGVGSLERVLPARPVVQQVRPPATRGIWGDVLRRLLANRLAVVSAIFLVLIIGLALAAPLVAPKGYMAQDYHSLRVGPSATSWLGTDNSGRDLWARLVYDGRISLTVGLGVQLVALLIGVPLGLLAGFVGGRVDALIMQVVDILYAFPTLLFAILLMSWLGQGVLNIVIALSLVGWLQLCRLVRAQALSLREREFVLAARALGVPDGQIMWRHLLPNLLSTIITTVTFGIPQAILNILYIRSAWHLALFPALALGLTMLAFTAFGDGLRDALDPRSKR